MNWNITPVQTTQNKKGNGSRQKYRQKSGGTFTEALLRAQSHQPQRQQQEQGAPRRDGFTQRFNQDARKERDIRELWRHVETVNRQITGLLAR